MRILAVETTGEIASAAVVEDGRVLAEELAESERKHAETIVPAIEAVLKRSALSLSEMDYYAVDIGPGSFTGIRIGVAVVNALAYANEKKVIPVDAFRVLSEPVEGENRPVAALIDARNKNVYGAVLENGEYLYGPAAEPFSDFSEKLPENALVVGNFPVEGFAFEENKKLPKASCLGLAALCLTETARETAVPLYLRPSQAERMKRRD